MLAPVRPSDDLRRILALPRRAPMPAEQEQAFARAWSWALLNDRGRAELTRIEALPQAQREIALVEHGRQGRPLLLNIVQARMIAEGLACGGLFADATVGAGKTLVSWLLPLVTGARRPVLFVQATLERDTHDKFKRLAEFWQSPIVPPFVVSYERLGTTPDLLCGCAACQRTPEDISGGLRPDVLIFDEADLLRNKKAARTMRVGRYITTHLSDVRAHFMTGTSLRKSLRDFSHLLLWALRLGAPVPISYVALQEWCEALDEGSRGPKRPPGALVQLAREPFPPGEELEAARAAFSQRYLETPGVVVSDEQSCEQPITIRYLAAPAGDRALDDAFRVFRETEATLDGWDVDDPLSQLRYGTELGLGFYYRWDPRPPQDWREARKEAAVFVRETIRASQRSGRPLDTVAQVYRAHPDALPLVRWKDVEPTFVPNTVPVPVSASVLGAAVQWINEHGPALVWTQHAYVGEALSQMSGVPYFGAKGRDKAGRYIMEHNPQRSAILSLQSNSRGRNLQAWNRCLVLGPPIPATQWEQGILGRVHRQGQTRPVFVDVLLSCAEDVRAIDRAISEAEWCQIGGRRQKLLLADHDWRAFPSERLALPKTDPARPRWTLPQW